MDWIIGENVPWSVCWTGEQSFGLARSRDFPGMTEVTQVERPGEGDPLLAMSHIVRNRRGVVRQLCHVCGNPTDHADRYVFPVATGAMITMSNGETAYGLNVPPVHLACGDRAKVLCPHLSRQYAQPVKAPLDDGRVFHRTDVTPGLEPLAKRVPAGLEVVYSCYRLYGAAFSAEVARMRAEAQIA